MTHLRTNVLQYNLLYFCASHANYQLHPSFFICCTLFAHNIVKTYLHTDYLLTKVLRTLIHIQTKSTRSIRTGCTWNYFLFTASNAMENCTSHPTQIRNMFIYLNSSCFLIIFSSCLVINTMHICSVHIAWHCTAPKCLWQWMGWIYLEVHICLGQVRCH